MMLTPVPITNIEDIDVTNNASDHQRSVDKSSNGIVGLFYALMLSLFFWTLVGAIGYRVHLMLCEH
jgi:hypothetical protein